MLALIRRPNAPWLFAGMVVVGVAVFGFAVGGLMLGPSAVVGDRLPQLTCLQVAFTPARFAGVFLNFEPAARAAIVELLVPGDVVFAWGYGLQLAGLTGLLAMRLPGRWQRIGAVVIWLPLVASTFDCIEDVFLWTAARTLVADPGASFSPLLPLLAGLAATVKYLALTVATPAYGLAGIVRGLSVDHSAVALLVYVLLGVLLVSMILRPLQQIPPCLF